MTIQTRPQFFYVADVNLSNQYLSFDEGSGEVIAEVDIGSYNPQALLDAVALAQNEVGSQVYTVTLDRTTNRVTIAAPAPFDLPITSGSTAASSIFGLLGFTGADLTGANTYTGNAAFATIYRPQLHLQGYTPFENNPSTVQVSVNESAQGVLEVLSFGERQFMEFMIEFITDMDQGVGGPIETDLSAVANARAFLTFITKRSPLEFMRDRDTPTSYEVIQLEKTASDPTGTGFKLREMFGKGLADYYETGMLTFRKVT